MTAQVTIAHPPRPPPPPAVFTHRLYARQTHVHSKSVANSRNVLRNNGQLYTFLLHPLFILKYIVLAHSSRTVYYSRVGDSVIFGLTSPLFQDFVGDTRISNKVRSCILTKT